MKTIDALKKLLSRKDTNSTLLEEIMLALSLSDQRIIGHWAKESTSPRGLKLVLLRQFLVNKGYEIDEMKNLEPMVAELIELIYQKAVSLADVAKILGYIDGAELLRVLRGDKPIIGSRRPAWEKFLKPTRASNVPVSFLPLLPPDKPLIYVSIRTTETINLLRIIKSSAALLSPRLQSLMRSTPEERRQLRETAGEDLVFKLANELFALQKQLDGLCSEKAFEIQNSDTEKESKS